MSQRSPTPDAWTRARDRFTEDLDEEEKRLYFTATPETLLYEISAKEKIHGEQSKSRHLISSIQPFIDSIDHFGKALDVFTNTYPLLAHDAGHYFDDVVNMIVKIGNVLPRIHVYEALFPNHERLVQALSFIYCDLLAFCDEAKKVLRKPKRSMLSITFKGFEHKFKKLLLRLQEHEKAVEKEVRASHMIESADSRSLVRLDQLQAAAERKETERWQVFGNLSDIDYEGQYARLDDLRHKGTCEWIVNEPLYQAWRWSTASSGLCCRGIPGSGKSILMAKIVTDSRACPSSIDDVTLFHFCDFARPATLQIGQIYRAILKQIYANNVMQETLIDKIVKGFKQSSHGIPEKQLQAFVIQAIETCKSQRINVVCDGLDECEENDQRTICDMLNCLAASDKSCIKVLVTCREEERPLKYLTAFEQLRLTPDISHADMEVFVVGAVQSCIERRDMTLTNSALRQEIISELVSKADGMFLWIHFQLLDLCEAASDARIRETLKNLPRGLDETYNRMLYKASNSLNAVNVKFALRWIACARRPLKVEELQEAAAFVSSNNTHGSPDQRWDADKIPDADKLLQSCHGLVVRDRDGTVRFAHHTVRQFLLITPSPFTRSEAETSIAELCATYLCFSDFESALTTTEKQQNLTINTIFKQGGPVAIPASLGIRRQIYDIPYRFLGGQSDFKVPDIDFAKQVRMRSAKVSVSSDLRAKYALLGYVIEYWAWHTNQEIEPSDSDRIDKGHRKCFYELDVLLSRFSMQRRLLCIGSLRSFGRFWRLVKDRQLAFEIRPWGSNQHFGPYGCLGCPPPDVPPSEVKTNLNLDGTSAIHWAAQSGHLPLLTSFGDDLSTYMHHEQYSQQTLILACRYGHAEIVALLLNHSDHSHRNDEAYVEACREGHLNVMQVLISSGRDLNPIPLVSRKFGAEQKKLAHFAAEFGHVHILQYILQSNRAWQADSLKDGSGRTMFHYAALNGHHEIIYELIKNGINTYDEKCWNQSMTPLMLAAQNGHAEAVRALLAAGADPKARGGSNLPIPLDTFPASLMKLERYSSLGLLASMAVHLAARYGHAEVLEVLPMEIALSSSKEHGDAKFHHERPQNAKNMRLQMSALHWAAVYGHARALQVMLNKGYDPNETNGSTRMTAMHFAAAMDYGEVIDVLLKHHADPQSITEKGETPLHIMSIYNKQASETAPRLVLIVADSIWYLNALAALIKAQRSAAIPVDYDCKIEEPDTRSLWHGMSALHIALIKGHNETAQMLLSAGASPIQQAILSRIYDSPEMAPLKISKQPLSMASASSLVDKKTLRQLYEATMNDPAPKAGGIAGPRCGRSAIQPRGTPRVPEAMAAAIETEQEVMVQVLLSRKNMYYQHPNMLQSAKHYADEHLMEMGRLDRLSSRYTTTKRIIALLDAETSRRQRE
ncbi:hypothetical protein G7Y79_00012g031930 [Physcia stellaris]|nr:hypothetical protein G7Y79_00012g031930 [Physcia stellaris]